MEHGAGTVETAHERLFQQLKIAVVASGELCLDLENREEVPLHCGGSTAGELEEIGVPLVRHDAGAGCQLAGKGEIAELLSAEDDDVLANPGNIVAKLGAPEQHGCLQLSAPSLHRCDVEIETLEAEGASDHAARQRQRDAIAGGAYERRAIHAFPHCRQRLERIEQSLGEGTGPETDGGGHRLSAM